MREFNALRSYPQSEKKVGTRTIYNRIIASYRGREFFDGDRDFGYGGLNYDGRWANTAQDIFKDYNLSDRSSVLQLNCEKGYLLHELAKLGVGKVVGVEPSKYAHRHAMDSVKEHYVPRMGFETGQFDLVIALGVVYTLNLPDAINCLREIERIGHNGFITLASYETEQDLSLFRQWSLLGTTILKKDEWKEVMAHAGYTGDYWFVNAETLKIRA